MDNKTAGIVSYLWWIGLAVVILTTQQRNEYVSFHLRQSLGLILCSLIVSILLGTSVLGAMVGYAAGLLLLVFWLIAFIGALNEEKKLVPLIGSKFQEWFKSI